MDPPTFRSLALSGLCHRETKRCWGCQTFRTQFRWSGHVSHMPDEVERIPKRMLYGQLPNAKRYPGGQRKRYKDRLHVNLKTCNTDYTKLEALAADEWRRVRYSAVGQFEQQRSDTAKIRRATRKANTFTNSSTSTSYIYDTFCGSWGYVCSSRIGIYGHNRHHRCDSSCRRLSPLVLQTTSAKEDVLHPMFVCL